MNRVVCCYPDMPRLAGAAADHARLLLVMSYPRRAWWTSVAIRLMNVFLRVARRDFEIFLHRPKQIIATVEQRGLKTVLDDAGPFWTVSALRRDRGIGVAVDGTAAGTRTEVSVQAAGVRPGSQATLEV
jgi:magnesium-protoporphyrin O-methyltransferase